METTKERYAFRPIRWSDRDRYFGPFTYSRDEKGYRPLAIELDSGDGDDYPLCRLRFSGFGHTLIVALPTIIKPWRERVAALSWDAATVARLGRNYYYNYHRRQYGIDLNSGYLSVSFGRQSNDSSTEQRKGWLLPWMQWRQVRHSFYDIVGNVFAHTAGMSRWGSPEYDAWKKAVEDCPTVSFEFNDHDGERITATTKMEEREQRLGEGRFKWLSVFVKPKLYRSLDIHFSAEVGARKGSWKGGTIGHSVAMLPGELHEAAFRRYCPANGMTFVSASPLVNPLD